MYVKLNKEHKMQHLSCNWLIIIKMGVAQKKKQVKILSFAKKALTLHTKRFKNIIHHL